MKVEHMISKEDLPSQQNLLSGYQITFSGADAIDSY